MMDHKFVRRDQGLINKDIESLRLARARKANENRLSSLENKIVSLEEKIENLERVIKEFINHG